MARTTLRFKEELEKIPLSVPGSHSRGMKRISRSRPNGLPSTREGRLRLYEDLVGHSKSSESAPRCRPKVPMIIVKVHDSDQKERIANVAYLQYYPDRLRALRECIEVMFPSTTDVYKRMDLDGCGKLSFKELEAALRRLHVPWQQVTGLTRWELLRLLGDERVDILQFLGKPGLTTRPHWSMLSLRNQWEDYCKKVMELNLEAASCCPPLWSNVGTMGEVILRRPSTVSVPLSREDSEYLQSKLVRIEKFLGDFAENKRELMKLKIELSGVTESEERLAEMKRRKDEEEREKQRIKKAAGMALVTTDGDNKISIFGKKGQLSVFSQPTYEELPHAFSGLVNQEDIALRNLYKEVGLSLLLGDRIHSAIRTVTSQNVINQHEFIHIMKYLRNISDENSGSSRIFSEWVSVSQGREILSIREFLIFCSRPETGFVNV